MDRREALAILAAAYESGIRHFDTAPLYCWGASEDLLGAFGVGKTDLTITTKAGITPPSRAARLISKAPGLPAARPRTAQFKPGQISHSLNTSLSRLRIDRVGVFLLHEPEASAVTDELAAELRTLKQSGKTAAIGIATSGRHSAALLARYPDTFDIVQIPVAELGLLPAHNGLTILHSVLGARLAAAVARLGDVDKTAVAHDLLRAALAQSRGGIVLYSSTRPDAVETNARLTPADPALLARVEEWFAADTQFPQQTATS